MKLIKKIKVALIKRKLKKHEVVGLAENFKKDDLYKLK